MINKFGRRRGYIRNCYIYTRVSTAVQADGYSLDAQTEDLRNYAEYRNLKIAGEYCDAGRSGMDTKGRPEFCRLIDDVMSQKDNVSFVLVFKLSRFGRNTADILKYLQILEDFDVNIVSVNESIDSSTQGGKLTLSILAAVAEMEHENITTQFYAAKLESIRRGGWFGGPIPYGYRRSDYGLVKDPYEAEVVRKIYELYNGEGGSATSVAMKLNKSGYKRKNRKSGEIKPFTYDFVKKVIGNPVYCGMIRFNQPDKKKKHVARVIKSDASHSIAVKGRHEAIISEDAWHEAQEKRKQLATSRERKNSYVHMLGGLIRCPVCGKSMTGTICRTKNPKSNEYYDKKMSYYLCRYHTMQNGGVCSYSKSLDEKIMDSLIIEILCRLQFNDEFKKAMNKELGTRETAESKEEQIRQLLIESRRAETEKDKIGEKLDGLDPLRSDYDEKYDKLSAEQDKIYDRIDELKEEIKKAREILEIMKQRKGAYTNVETFLKNLRPLFGRMTSEERKELCKLIIERIDVFPENRPDGKIIRSISFRFPLRFDGCDPPEAEGETFSFTLNCEDIDVALPDDKSLEMVTAEDGSQKVIVRKPTYAAIRKYVKTKFDAHVSSLYVAQIKRKYGVKIGEAYNKPKTPGGRVPHCPAAKEKMILDSFKDFGLLDKDIEYKESRP